MRVLLLLFFFLACASFVVLVEPNVESESAHDPEAAHPEELEEPPHPSELEDVKESLNTNSTSTDSIEQNNEHVNPVREENGLLILDDTNFEVETGKHDILLVLFYAPWCQHCKELIPIFEDAAAEVKKEVSLGGLGKSLMAKIDIDKYKSIAKLHDIQYLPTIKIFYSGEADDYSSGRTKEDFVKFLKKKVGPAARVLKSVKEVEDFVKENIPSFVFFGEAASLDEQSKSKTQILLPHFHELAAAYEELEFAECHTPECLTHFNVKPGNVIAFKNFDNGNQVLQDEYTPKTLKYFLDINTVPKFSPFNERVGELVFGKHMPGVFFFRRAGDAKTKQIDEIAKHISEEEKYSGKIQVTTCDAETEIEKRLIEYLRMNPEALPVIKIFDTRDAEMLKYTFEGDVTDPHEVQHFINNFFDGKLEHKVKSQNIPDVQEGDVLTLVAKNFKEIVFDEKKDVLVEFYAPWCGHCKEFAPIYEELATKLKAGNPNLIIAKIDSTANDIDDIEISGYPTIKLFRRNRKNSPLDFHDEREIKNIVSFLEEHVEGFIKPIDPEEEEEKETLEQAVEKAKARDSVVHAADEKMTESELKEKEDL